jgi:hypothetical protein
MQWVHKVREKSPTHPLDGSVVQRLQRFATYGSLKQQVLRIITDELAAGHEEARGPLEKVCFNRLCPLRSVSIDSARCALLPAVSPRLLM